ncbi:MAG: response regulator [Myxococcota bacterium]
MTRIVLVEDQQLVREGLRRLLEQEPRFRVVAEAADGDAALLVLANLETDVVLLDVRLPGRSGLEVLAALRQRGWNRPVLMLTTFHDPVAWREAERLGAAGFLLKDVSFAELVAALDHVTAGGPFLAPRLLDGDAPPPKLAAALMEQQPEHLTPREKEILRLVAEGRSNSDIAAHLGTAQGTVKNQVSSVISKLGVRDRAQAVLKALSLRWLE